MRTALVIGGASCVHEDILATRGLFVPDLVIAVNNIGISYPKIDHWVSFHPEQFVNRLGKRRQLGLADPSKLWSHQSRRPPDDLDINIMRSRYWGGSSGLLAVQVALIELGCTRIVLAGIPLTETGHFDREKLATWKEAKKYQDAWKEHLPALKDQVRSMSGWTRELLGAPNEEWLQHAKQEAVD